MGGGEVKLFCPAVKWILKLFLSSVITRYLRFVVALSGLYFSCQVLDKKLHWHSALLS